MIINHPSIVFSKRLGLATGYLVIQQLIVASSSIWITKLILHIPEGYPALTWLWLYLASLLLPYIPGTLAYIEMTKEQMRAVIEYVQKFSKIYPGRILEWSNHEQHNTKSSILSGEAYPAITSYYDYFYMLGSTSLSVILNSLTLAILIDPWLLIAYVIGVGMAFFVLHLQKNARKRLALKAQHSRIRWTALLLKAWDNILLNNVYNLNIWNQKTQERGGRLVAKAVESVKFSQSISIIMAFVLMSPSMIFIVYLAHEHIHDVAFLAILTVILPRLFQILLYSYELLFLMSEFPMQKARLKTVLSLLDPEQDAGEAVGFQQRIVWDRIRGQLKEGSTPSVQISPQHLLQSLPSKGRITLQGGNGSGKTSLLLSLKIKLGEKAFYLPSKHELLFQIGRSRASTGQLSLQILNELKRNVKTPYILLDEWDANLDKNNREEMTTLIDELALNHCVIEVIHLRGGGDNCF